MCPFYILCMSRLASRVCSPFLKSSLLAPLAPDDFFLWMFTNFFLLTVSPCNLVHSLEILPDLDWRWVPPEYTCLCLYEVFKVVTNSKPIYLFTYLLHCEVQRANTQLTWLSQKYSLVNDRKAMPWDSQLCQETILPAPREPLLLLLALYSASSPKVIANPTFTEITLLL